MTLVRRLRSFLRPLVERASLQLGQATAEYALVILGAVTVAGLLLAWASHSRAVDRLFDTVVSRAGKAVR